MKNFLYTCCALLGLTSLTNCTKENVAEPDKGQTHENTALTATIEDVTTKTNLDGVKVTWSKGDQIAIQLSSKHQDNHITKPNSKPYLTTFGIYNLADDAAGKNVGEFTLNRENTNSKEEISGDEEFFAFYPASFCSVDSGNGYFYFTFPQKQYYEDVMGDKFPLPMYGIGKNKNIEFQYAGSVIKLLVWSAEKDVEIRSCEVVADGGFANRAFTYIDKDGKWPEKLSHASNVGHFTLEMLKPIPLSDNPNNPTELKIVLPQAGNTKTFTNLKFSINCTKNGNPAGCELVKKSKLEIKRGTIVSFPVTKLELKYTRMYIDGGIENGGMEGELDFDVIKKAKKSVKITMPSGTKLIESDFRQIIEATRNLEKVDNIESIQNLETTESSNRQIIVDLSETTAAFGVINGLDNTTKKYVGFCGGYTKETGIKNISELYLPKGITTIKNMAFSNSDYKKIVLPSTLTVISGMPASGCNSLKWEVAEGNKIFWTDTYGALYGIKDTNIKTLIALNGGSGETYSIQEGTQEIGAYSMYENSVLTTLALPKSIQKIGENGLGMTPSLTTIIIYGMPIFNPSTGSNTVGNKDAVKTLYVEDEQQYNTYMQRIKEYNEKYKIDLLKKNNWQIAKLTEYKGTIPAENPAKDPKTN